MKKHVLTLASQGYYVIKARSKKVGEETVRQFRTFLFAENKKVLNSSNQWFERVEIARENILQSIHAVNGTKALVVDRSIKTEVQYYWLKKDGTRKFLKEKDCHDNEEA